LMLFPTECIDSMTKKMSHTRVFSLSVTFQSFFVTY
jgi:hypothetical protein